MADLKEVVRRVKEAEKKRGEGKLTKIPRVTRNVGLQITATLAPVQPPGRPTPSPSPSLSEEVLGRYFSAALIRSYHPRI